MKGKDMVMNEPEVLFDKWEVIEHLEPSGQGENAVVKQHGKNDTYVIKVLKNPTTKNKKRFVQEINILKKCNFSPFIPKIIEQNKDKNYYVMEHIQGETLDKILQKKENRNDFDGYLHSIMNLLAIVKYYSSLGIIHRDIKPGNIMCREGDISKVSLIDFGIAYDQNCKEDFTMIGEELGNRFLHLPELQNGNKRDVRSDITFCVGILYFMLTGEKPSTLYVNKCKPHERSNAIIKLQWLGSERLKIINDIFDKGFNQDIEERFQTVDDLVFALNELNYRFYSDHKRNSSYSFTLATVNRSMGQKKSSVERQLALEKYKEKDICIGQVKLYELEDKYRVIVEKDEYLKSFEKYYVQYSSLKDLFIPKNEKIKQMLSVTSNADTKFELSNKVHIEDGRIYFDNFKIINYLYEIDIKKVLQPIFYKKIEIINVLTVELKKDKLLIYYKSGEIEILNLKGKNMKSINTHIENAAWMELSPEYNWLVYSQNRTEIELCHFDGFEYREYELKIFDDLSEILECTFVSEKELLIVASDRISVINLDTQKETTIIKNKYINLLEYVSPNKNFCIILCGRIYKKRILVNIENHGSIMLDRYSQIVESVDDELYLSSYDSISRIECSTGEKIEKIIDFHDKSEAFRDSYNVITRINKGVFFNTRKNKNSFRFEKNITYGKISEKNVWSMTTHSEIIKLLLYKNGVVTLEENGELIIWQMNI